MGNCRSKEKKNTTQTNSSISAFGGSDNNDDQHIEAQLRNHSLGNKAPNGATKPNLSNKERTSLATEAVISSTREEVNTLLGKINAFHGSSESDTNYRFLDEMLTRCILNLDKIKCKDSRDRCNRKQAIKEVNQAISILERKLEINSDIKKLELNLADS